MNYCKEQLFANCNTDCEVIFILFYSLTSWRHFLSYMWSKSRRNYWFDCSGIAIGERSTAVCGLGPDLAGIAHKWFQRNTNVTKRLRISNVTPSLRHLRRPLTLSLLLGNCVEYIFKRVLFVFVSVDNVYRCISDADQVSFIRYYKNRTGNSFDHEQLQYVLRDLVMAGMEPTGTTLLWSLVLLANNPEVQSKIRREIDSVVSRDRLPSLEDKSLGHLKYTEATILEIMRIRTVVPFQIVETRRDTYAGKYFIPAKTFVSISLVKK